MSKKKYYVVDWGNGAEPQLFDSWDVCLKAITGRAHVSHYGYKSLEEAEAAIRTIAGSDRAAENSSGKPDSTPAFHDEAYPELLRLFYKMHAGAYEVHSDGGARPNPGSGGYGFVVVDPDGNIAEEGYGSCPDATNNQMELTGAIEGFRAVPDGAEVIFMTDSKLVYTGLGRNLDSDPRPRFLKWEERKWKGVKNLNLVQTLYQLGKEHRVSCIPRPLNAQGTDYARMGHLEHGAQQLPDGKWEFPYNKICDKLAEFGEADAAEGKTGQAVLITGGREVDARALYASERDAYGHGNVINSAGEEADVN